VRASPSAFAATLAESAGWDRELLAIELPELAEILVVEGLDVSITGFSPVEIDQLTVDFEEDPTDPDDTLDPAWTTAAPVSKPGELWELGSHRLPCGDARNADHVARLMGGAHASMAFLDPPDNVRVRDIVASWTGEACRIRDGVGRALSSGFSRARWRKLQRDDSRPEFSCPISAGWQRVIAQSACAPPAHIFVIPGAESAGFSIRMERY
jgi:hypothetical protein